MPSSDRLSSSGLSPYDHKMAAMAPDITFFPQEEKAKDEDVSPCVSFVIGDKTFLETFQAPSPPVTITTFPSHLIGHK